MTSRNQGRFSGYCAQQRRQYVALMLEVDEQISQHPHPSVQERAIIEPLQLAFASAAARLARADAYSESMGCPRCYIEDGISVPMQPGESACGQCKTSFETVPERVAA